MDINTQNSSGMMNGIPPVPKTEKKIGPIIGVLIIVIILIIAALYFFGQNLNIKDNSDSNIPVETSQSNIDENVMTATATEADDIDSLNADLDIQLKDVDYSF